MHVFSHNMLKTSRKRKHGGQQRFVRRVRRRAMPVVGPRAMSQWSAPATTSLKASLRYNTVGTTLNPGAGGSISVHVFSANGMYDPDVSGSGHQPRGFDQYMAMYDHYCVIGSKITVMVSPRAGSTYPVIVGISQKDAGGPLANGNEYMESRGTTFRLLGARESANVATLTSNFSLRKFQTIKNWMDNPDLRGSAASNPVEQSYFHVWAEPVQGQDSQPLDVVVTVDYIAVFTEPHTPVQS